MLDIVGLGIAIYMNTFTIEKPTIPLTTVIEGREINRKDIEIEKYITKPFKEDEEWIDTRISYYTISNQCTGKLDGISASGKNLKTISRGGTLNNITYIAAPKSVPFGTKLYIEGIGICEVVDRGGAIFWDGNTMKIDIFVPNATNKELQKLGVKYTKAKIIK